MIEASTLANLSSSDLFRSSQSLVAGQQRPGSGSSHQSQKSHRFYYWSAFSLFSLVVAGSSIEATDRILPSEQAVANQKWAVVCSIVSFCVAVGVVFVHFSPILATILVGSRLEGMVCFIMVVLWSALIAVISDSRSGLAVDKEGSVTFGNLYYCGWAGFVCAVLLSLNYLKTVFHLNIPEELSVRSNRLNLWIGYFIVSVILTSSAGDIFDHECLESARFGSKFCNRAFLALLVGGAGTAASFIVIGVKFAKGMSPWGFEMILSTSLFLCNCFSMGLVTAEDGPGAKIGNLYYFSWFSLIFSFSIMSATSDYVSKRNDQDDKDSAVDLYETHDPDPETSLQLLKLHSDVSDTPTMLSAGMDSYSSSIHVTDPLTQPYLSQKADPSIFVDEPDLYGELQSEPGRSFTSSTDQSNLKRQNPFKGQFYASSLDSSDQGAYNAYDSGADSFSTSSGRRNLEKLGQSGQSGLKSSAYSDGSHRSLQKPGRGTGYHRGDSHSSGLSFEKPGSGSVSYGSASSLQKPGTAKSFDQDRDSYASGFSIKQARAVKMYSEYGDSYPSVNSVQKPGSGSPFSSGGDSFSSEMSFRKPGTGKEFDQGSSSYASRMNFQKAESWRGYAQGGDSYVNDVSYARAGSGMIDEEGGDSYASGMSITDPQRRTSYNQRSRWDEMVENSPGTARVQMELV